MTVSEKLEQINTIKGQIRDAVNQKGGNLSSVDPFSAYPAAVKAISGGVVPEGARLIQVTSENSEMGQVFGGGAASDGMLVTAHAIPNSIYAMVGWYENDEFQSGDYDYIFQVERDRNLVAKWDNRFVAGKDWFESEKVGIYYNCRGIAYGNGMFVGGIYDTKRIIYSLDGGYTWTSDVALPTNRYWGNIAYGDGKFVLLGGTAKYGAYSENGLTWREIMFPMSATWSRIVYGNGIFVAVGVSSSDSYIISSTDGINWSIAYASEATSITALSYGNGMFIAALNNSKIGYYSIDGITWYVHSNLPYSYNWSCSVYAFGRFLLFGDESLKAAYSEDGIHWNPMNTPATNVSWKRAICNNNILIAIPSAGASTEVGRNLYYSTDGSTWRTLFTLANSDFGDITYGDGVFVLTLISGQSSETRYLYSRALGPYEELES